MENLGGFMACIRTRVNTQIMQQIRERTQQAGRERKASTVERLAIRNE